MERRALAACAALLLLALCNGTRTADTQQMLDGGAEELGLIGSIRHQMQVVPMQGRPLFRGQIIADEPMMAQPGAPRLRREALVGDTTTADEERAKLGESSLTFSNQVAMFAQGLRIREDTDSRRREDAVPEVASRPKREATGASAPAAAPAAPAASKAEASPGAPPATGATDPSGASAGAQLRESLAKAGKQLQSYGDQLAAQIPKRLRREAVGASASTSPAAAKVEASAPAASSAGSSLRDSLAKAGTQLQSYGDQLAAQIPKRLRRQADPQKALSGQASGEVANPLAQLGEQIQKQGAAAVQSLQNLGNSFVASVQPMLPKRRKRQVSYPSGEQTPPQTSEKSSNGIVKYLSELGQQAQQAQAIQQLLSAAGASGSQQQPQSNPLAAIGQSASSSSSSGIQGVAQMMKQLTDLIKSTQERNARVLETSQRSLESGNQQTMEVARSAQGGIQSALSEMGQGLQRLAANNPNLLPDIKNLYQAVSARLSSATSSVAQSVSGGGQTGPNLPMAQS